MYLNSLIIDFKEGTFYKKYIMYIFRKLHGHSSKFKKVIIV